MSKLYTGLSAFPLTPANSKGVVDMATLGVLIERLVKAGVDSVGLLGSTGIYVYLDRAERSRAVAAAHYRAVAGATALPLCAYNNPGTTNLTFSDVIIAELAAVPGIAAIEMQLPADDDYASELARLRATTPETFAIGYSGDWGAAPSLLADGDAWYSVVAGLLPEPASRLTRAAQSGDTDKAAAINAAFTPLWALFKAHGSLRLMYAIADRLALPIGGPPLPLMRVEGDVVAPLDNLGALQRA